MSTARNQLALHGVTWTEDGAPAGFLVGKAAALSDWRIRKEIEDPEFQHLVWRLQARKYWRAKNPASKARIYEYRREWRRRNYDRYRAAVNACRRRLRANPEYWARELATKRARHALKSATRRAATVYTCLWCGAKFGPDPKKRIPTRPPQYCPRPRQCIRQAWWARNKARILAARKAKRSKQED
jgi:hypothetical protein